MREVRVREVAGTVVQSLFCCRASKEARVQISVNTSMVMNVQLLVAEEEGVVKVWAFGGEGGQPA